MASSKISVNNLKSAIVNVSGTTNANGIIIVGDGGQNFTSDDCFVVSNISYGANKNYLISVSGVYPEYNTVGIKYRNASTGAVVANTAITDRVLLIGR